MSVNVTVQSGVMRSPALRYDHQSRPEFRFTLDQADGEWHLYLPCCAVGATAERLAGDLDDGVAIVITSGKLCYRKRPGSPAGTSYRDRREWCPRQHKSA
jgi:hypothetical protein